MIFYASVISAKNWIVRAEIEEIPTSLFLSKQSVKYLKVTLPKITFVKRIAIS